MTATLIARTMLLPAAYELLPAEDGVAEADLLHEIAGRECYQAQHKPNPATATNDAYLANVIRQGHTSVLAHASFTFRLTEVSRSLTHELIRHRFLAVSELSQRYVDMAQSHTVVPPALRDELGGEAADWIAEHHGESVTLYEELVSVLTQGGMARKKAREAARCVLPGGTVTSMIVSGNVRAWRDFLSLRWSESADAEICEMAGQVVRQIEQWAPNSIADLLE